MQLSETPSKPIRSGILLAVGGAILFSSKGIFIKYAYADGLSTETVMLFRMLLSLPVFLYIAIKSSKAFSRSDITRRDIMAALYCGIFGYYLSTWLSFFSLHFISVQLERIILFSYPALVVLMAAIAARAWPTRRMGGAALLTYLGVASVFGYELLAGNTEQASPTNIALGAASVGMAAVFYASYVLASKSLITKFGSALFTGVTMSISAVAIGMHSLIIAFSEQDMATFLPAGNSFIPLVMIAVLGTIIPSFMLAEAIARVGPERTAISGTMGPVAAALIAVTFLGEAFTVFHALSLVLCTAGIVLITRRKSKTMKE
ncbi:MAG: hypothetical protein COB37_10625 [Kordiimonadales bacterium]|nr:MAG: hypothetical protein COB37_10625 [Kordiimonadales bacterium]